MERVVEAAVHHGLRQFLQRPGQDRNAFFRYAAFHAPHTSRHAGPDAIAQPSDVRLHPAEDFDLTGFVTRLFQ